MENDSISDLTMPCMICGKIVKFNLQDDFYEASCKRSFGLSELRCSEYIIKNDLFGLKKWLSFSGTENWWYNSAHNTTHYQLLVALNPIVFKCDGFFDYYRILKMRAFT